MYIDPALTVAGFVVGLLVGLIGMGGGALLTPILLLLFRTPPLAAISSDLLTSLVMKPVGAAVHIRHRTVRWRLVGLLVAGAVPSAFAGAVLVGQFGRSPGATGWLTVLIGIMLCLAVGGTVLRQVQERRADRAGGDTGEDTDGETRPVAVRPLVTFLIGVGGGLAVGVTSVGAGSLIMAMLMLTHPGLRPSQLVGTDIVQAVPLVASAALGHLLFGDVHLAFTTSLIVGAVPGVYLGARLSARGPARVIRPLIVAVLLTSALTLLGVGMPWIAVGAGAALLAQILLSLPARPGTREPAAAGAADRRYRRRKGVSA